MTAASDSARLTDLEMLMTHVQRDVESLNAVVLEQQKQIDRLQRTIKQFEDRIQRLAEPEAPVFDSQVERPPHW